MTRPQFNVDMSLDNPRERRSKLTAKDILESTGEEAMAPVTVPMSGKAQVMNPEPQPVEEAATVRKSRAKKKTEGDKTVMLGFRLPAKQRLELERVAQLHSQPASFVVKKLIDQWMARTQDKREEILTK